MPDRAWWDTDAHRERYRKIMYREMTLEEALAETARDFSGDQTAQLFGASREGDADGR